MSGRLEMPGLLKGQLPIQLDPQAHHPLPFLGPQWRGWSISSSFSFAKELLFRVGLI